MSNLPDLDPYRELGVAKDASLQDIIKKYRQLALKRAPDKGGSTVEMARLNVAYDLLKDEDLRRQVDERGPLDGGADATPSGPIIPLSDGSRFSDVIKRVMEEARQSEAEGFDEVACTKILKAALAALSTHDTGGARRGGGGGGTCAECGCAVASDIEYAKHWAAQHNPYTQLMREYAQSSPNTYVQVLEECGMEALGHLCTLLHGNVPRPAPPLPKDIAGAFATFVRSVKCGIPAIQFWVNGLRAPKPDDVRAQVRGVQKEIRAAMLAVVQAGAPPTMTKDPTSLGSAPSLPDMALRLVDPASALQLFRDVLPSHESVMKLLEHVSNVAHQCNALQAAAAVLPSAELGAIRRSLIAHPTMFPLALVVSNACIALHAAATIPDPATFIRIAQAVLLLCDAGEATTASIVEAAEEHSQEGAAAIVHFLPPQRCPSASGADRIAMAQQISRLRVDVPHVAVSEMLESKWTAEGFAAAFAFYGLKMVLDCLPVGGDGAVTTNEPVVVLLSTAVEVAGEAVCDVLRSSKHPSLILRLVGLFPDSSVQAAISAVDKNPQLPLAQLVARAHILDKHTVKPAIVIHLADMLSTKHGAHKASLRILGKYLSSWGQGHEPSKATQFLFHKTAAAAIAALDANKDNTDITRIAATRALQLAADLENMNPKELEPLRTLASTTRHQSTAVYVASNVNPAAALAEITKAFDNDDVDFAVALCAAWKQRLGQAHPTQLSNTDRAFYFLAFGVAELMAGASALQATRLINEALLCAAVTPLSDDVDAFAATVFASATVRHRILGETIHSLCDCSHVRQLSQNVWLQDALSWFSRSVQSGENWFVQYIRGPEAAVLKQNEERLGAFKGDALKIALWYCDLIPAAGGEGLTQCALLAAWWMLRAYDNVMPTTAVSDLNALATAALTLLQLCGDFLQKLPPCATSAASGVFLGLLAQMVALPVGPRSSALRCFVDCLPMFERHIAVFPVGGVCGHLAGDTLFRGVVHRGLLVQVLEKLWQGESGDDSLVPRQRIAYLMFEGTLRGWRRTEELAVARMRCMQTLIQERGGNQDTWKHTSGLIDWVHRERHPNGFVRKSGKGCMVSAAGTPCAYASVTGMHIDLETGVVNFNLAPADTRNKGGPVGLFDMGDIAEVARGGELRAAFFSLDEIDGSMRSCPFQQMRFSPASLQDTRFLGTMFQADYILKFLTTGVEVSAVPPFDSQNIALSVMFAELPQALREICAQLHGDGEHDKKRGEVAHRFWIEAGEIPFDMQQSNSGVTVKLGHPKMLVKKHLMRRDRRTGELVDANDPEDDSPEAKFAEQFTANYDRFADYFPELARLRELLKLAFLSHIVASTTKSIQSSLRDLEATRNEMTTTISQALAGVRGQVTYPRASNQSEIERCVALILDDTYQSYRNQAGFSQQSWDSQLTRLRGDARSSVVTQLRNADRGAAASLAPQLADSFGVSHSVVTVGDTQQFLDGNNTRLCSALVQTHLALKRQKLTTCANNLNQLGYVARDEPTSMSTKPISIDPLGWVPAAMAHRAERFVVGGVLLGVKTCPYNNAFNPPRTTQVRLEGAVLNQQRHSGPAAMQSSSVTNASFNAAVHQVNQDIAAARTRAANAAPDVSRRAAWRQVLRDCGIPTSQARPPPTNGRQTEGHLDYGRGISQPKVPGQLFRHCDPNTSTHQSLMYVATNASNKGVIIRDDFAGHHGMGAHYNVGDRNATWRGTSMKDQGYPDKYHFFYNPATKPY